MMSLILTIAFAGLTACIAQSPQESGKSILTGADRTSVYAPMLKGKRVGIFANQTTIMTQTGVHVVDALLAEGIKVVKIFAPEHGFRGTADAGEKITNSVDEKTGVPIVSLYGSKRAPDVADLQDIDVLIFDVQDVGTRFYTYISSLEYVMNACIENAKPLLILDRPNPNGFYVDGPILDKAYQTFVGRQAIPVVHGLTIGEYAQMLVGERWLSDKANRNMDFFKKAKPTADTPFHMLVIKCAGYTHKSYYALPVKPSPNLPDMQSILLYPSTCYFEGTSFSLGRGTDRPFQLVGHPELPKDMFSFTPQSVPGATDPPLLGKTCYGWNLSKEPIDIKKKNWQRIQLQYLIDAYAALPDKDRFFLRPSKGNPARTDYFFNKLAGNDELMVQIMNGVPEQEIRESWQPGLKTYKAMRKKYLLYPDFE